MRRREGEKDWYHRALQSCDVRILSICGGKTSEVCQTSEVWTISPLSGKIPTHAIELPDLSMSWYLKGAGLN